MATQKNIEFSGITLIGNSNRYYSALGKNPSRVTAKIINIHNNIQQASLFS